MAMKRTSQNRTRARRGADARASVPPLLGPAVILQLEGAGQAPEATGLAAAPPPPLLTP